MSFITFFTINFILTLLAVAGGFAIAIFFRPLIERKAESAAVKRLQRRVGVRPPVEITSPSKILKDKQFLNTIAHAE